MNLNFESFSDRLDWLASSCLLAMQTVGAFEAKTHLSSLLDSVCQGEQIVITRHGCPIARLVPAEGPDQSAVQAAIARLRQLSQGQTLNGITVQELRDTGRRA
ncbi:type II toxin-antitoxin system Phd/YefM family antitoxin [Synechococcus elongatus]|uniref:type II toxin-antitoxin system Phd/YefM family antitoxin n=1 Tax=Synechococcus elongatus TaxID=32046 RepID=UPI0003138AED|nr:type II toxin-antitoxin system prevent-host-death family antitoxin [Synechococcus elongatus]WKW06780.1 type II toxin-antitoxin system prevent-host-death family antitoxin [Synechococcus elongatus PCC 7942 = FACHB-805]